LQRRKGNNYQAAKALEVTSKKRPSLLEGGKNDQRRGEKSVRVYIRRVLKFAREMGGSKGSKTAVWVVGT